MYLILLLFLKEFILYKEKYLKIFDEIAELKTKIFLYKYFRNRK